MKTFEHEGKKYMVVVAKDHESCMECDLQPYSFKTCPQCVMTSVVDNIFTSGKVLRFVYKEVKE